MYSVCADLLAAKKYAYEPNALYCSNILIEKEGQDYGACTFVINNRQVVFRTAKVTPKKIGQFVTLWKRVDTGPILPYDIADSIDLFVVSIRSGEHFGQFVFPKSVLCEKNVVSQEGKGGRRALRVYPPWVFPHNQQAKRTQIWQQHYFFIFIPQVIRS